MLLFFLYPRKDALYACSYYECMSMVTVVKWVASVPDIGPCWFSDIFIVVETTLYVRFLSL